MAKQHSHKLEPLEVVQELDGGKYLVGVDKEHMPSIAKALDTLEVEYSVAQYTFSDYFFVECDEKVADFLARWYAPANKERVGGTTLLHYSSQDLANAMFHKGYSQVKYK